MRLILTNLGEQILKSINIPDNVSRISKPTNDTKSTKPETEISVIMPTQSKIKQIHVLKKKVSLPKHIVEKYNSPDDQDDKIEQSPRPKEDPLPHTFGNVIHKKAIASMKVKAIKEVMDKNESMMRVNIHKFRTPVNTNKKALDHINKMTKSPLNPEAHNLIKYLSEKKAVSSTFLDKLSRYEDNRFTKLDKICQRYLHNRDKEKLMNDLIKRSVEKDNHTVLTTLNKGVQDVDRTMDRMRESSARKYEFDKREMYRDIHEEFKLRYWSNNRLARSKRVEYKVSNESVSRIMLSESVVYKDTNK
jgi:hypothetical protein